MSTSDETAALPHLMVLKPEFIDHEGNYVYYEEGGLVKLGKESVFSMLVKIEVEQAKSNDKYVHLRFPHSNRYLHKSVNNNTIVAESDRAVEDVLDPSCTLLEPIQSDFSPTIFCFRDVGSGGIVRIDASALAFYVDLEDTTTTLENDYLSYVEWEKLAKLPEHVAFKGDNGLYLQASEYDGTDKQLMFGSKNPNNIVSGHKVELMPDGHVRMHSDQFSKFWRSKPIWIFANSSDTTGTDLNTQFWPHKVDEVTIAFLCRGSRDKYCVRNTADTKRVDCLAATATSVEAVETHMVVEELVSQRDIRHVAYRVEYGRVLYQKDYVAGSTMLINDQDVDVTQPFVITYYDARAYTFSRGFPTVALDVPTLIHDAALPFISTEGDIEIITSKITEAVLDWETTKTIVTPVEVSGIVTVPARSWLLVEYVGLRGSLDVPFSYTQDDTSSVDQRSTTFKQVQGIYSAINSYNFEFRYTQM